MDLKNFRDNENWLSYVTYVVGGQLDDLDFGLNEDMEALNVGGRHLGSQDIQHGFTKTVKKVTNLMIFGRQQLCNGLLVCMCPHK